MKKHERIINKYLEEFPPYENRSSIGSSKIDGQRQALIDELYGILKGTDMTLEEVKEERLKKYEE